LFREEAAMKFTIEYEQEEDGCYDDIDHFQIV